GAVAQAVMRRGAPAVEAATQGAVRATQAASRVQEMLSAAEGQPIASADRVVLENLARGTGEKAGAAARALAAEEGRVLTGAGRAAHAASLVAAPVIFGPIQAYAQQALMHVTGHDVEMPKASDLFGAKALEDIGVLGIVGALGARGAFERVQPAEPTF